MISRPIRSLSGGEKARFVLAQLAAERPALLVLDEPTNHLDLDMRDALALALQAYAGAVLIVAHDRDLLEKIVDELWVVEEGGLHSYSGDLNQYTASRLSNTTSGPRTKTAPATDARSKKEQRRERAASRESLSHLKKEVRNLEAELEEAIADLQRMESTLADQKTYSGLAPDELTELLTRAGTKRRALERVEENWLEAVARLESHDEN